MLNIIVWIIIAIDLTVVVPMFIKGFIKFPWGKLYRSGSSFGGEMFSNKEKKQTHLILKILILVILLPIISVIIVIIIGIPTSIIWAPILIGIIYNWKASLIILSLCFSMNTLLGDLLIVYTYKKNKINITNVLINDWLLVISVILPSIFIIFQSDLNLIINIKNIIDNVNFIPIFLAAIYPVFLLALITTNFYIFYIKIKSIITKKTTFKTTNLLLIFVFSCFFGIIFINNMDTTLLDENQKLMLYRNINIVQMIMTSILIPLIIKKLFDKRGHIKEEVNGG